ncbi:MAG: hypothetical protein HZA01_08480 [Nitrospinae bacterium]|nr:hypothetical protein [Nitrospinota bacterium]
MTGVDLACLQLLCSACKTSLSRNKKAEITGAIPEIFSKTVREAGFARQKGCGMDRGPGCL